MIKDGKKPIGKVDMTKENSDVFDEFIVKMSPYLKSTIWGGDKLYKKYHKGTGQIAIAESWEISAISLKECKVADGKMKGSGFSDYLNNIGKKYWGSNLNCYKEFPILIKFIDANQNLSIQVHPIKKRNLRMKYGISSRQSLELLYI